MSESLEAIFHHFIWNFCYLSVLLGLSAYGIHRFCIIYLFLKNRSKHVLPKEQFAISPRDGAVTRFQRVLCHPPPD